VHWAPDELTSPWLLSMDPMTFSERETADDDNKLHPSDRPLVRAALDSFVATGLPRGVSRQRKLDIWVT
ncbi:MAG: hypothetical protein ACE1ZP_05075, partial [Myxococcota bacterium]